MQNKRLKLICFSVTGSGANECEFSWGKLASLLGVVFLILLALTALSVSLFTDFYHNIENASLTKVNKILRSQLTQMGGQVDHIQAKIEVLESKDDELRLIADLPKIDSDTRNVGVGGSSINAVAFSIPVSDHALSDDLVDYQQLLDEVERRIELTRASQDQVGDKLVENKNIMKHLPSIRPTLDGTIKDRFGLRKHPLLDKIRQHPGVDISSPRGAEVFSTAAGIVEKVVTKYTVNRSYGKYVIINHGSGLKTLYGHLAKVLVKKGQEVDRRKPIGLIGETGLATGPHLHYEVIKDGQRENPLKFILDDKVF